MPRSGAWAVDQHPRRDDIIRCQDCRYWRQVTARALTSAQILRINHHISGHCQRPIERQCWPSTFCDDSCPDGLTGVLQEPAP